MQDGTPSVVKVEVTVKGGLVAEVFILAGPRLFRPAVSPAILKCSCVLGADETMAIQEIPFNGE